MIFNPIRRQEIIDESLNFLIDVCLINLFNLSRMIPCIFFHYQASFCT